MAAPWLPIHTNSRAGTLWGICTNEPIQHKQFFGLALQHR